MEPWVSESNNKSLVFMTALLFVAGVVLTMNTWGVEIPVSSNARCGLFLGILLLVASGIVALKIGREVVTVDPFRKCIEIEKKTIFGINKKQVFFADIQDVLIGRMGKTSGYLILYYLILKMKDGKEMALFTPGYFDGCFDRPVVEGWRIKLEEYLQKQ